MHQPRLDFYVKTTVVAYTTLQLASFAFSEATIPSSPELQEAFAWTRELGLGSERVFPIMFASACGAVITLVLVFVAQEQVEWQKFLNPENNKWQYLWLAMSLFAQTMVTVAFIPLCRTLARSGDCTIDEMTGTYWLDALNGTESNPTPDSALQCFTTTHLTRYAGPGFVLFVLFTTLSARLILAGGELSHIEMTLANPLACGSDSKKVPAHMHALSACSLKHDVFSLCAKTVAVLASTYLGSKHPTVVAGIFMSVGLATVGITLRSPPYFGRGDGSPVLRSTANRMRCAVDLGLLWVFVCMLVASLMRSSDDANPSAADDVMLRVLPACVIVFLVGGYWLPSCQCCARQSVAVAPQHMMQ